MKKCQQTLWEENGQNMKKIIWARIGWMLWTGIMMGVITLFSSQAGPQSNAMSSGLLTMLLEHLPKLSPEQIEFCHFLLRKCAHFTLYFLLGIGMMGSFLTTHMTVRQAFLASCICCALFAAGDEWHQYLSGTRTGSVKDVILDTCGALCSSAAFGAIRTRIQKG